MAAFLWGVFPYLAISCLVIGSVWRRVTRPLGWSAKSSEFFEKRWLSLASPLFHWGILCVLAGHVAGLLVPIGVYHALGVSDEVYHAFAMWAGGVAGLAASIGILLLGVRRAGVVRVRVNSTVGDWVALALLAAVVWTGTAMTIGYNAGFGPYEYRTTVGPWLRSVLALHPDVARMSGVPGLLQLHVILSFALFAATPFTRLVNVWSAPLRYPARSPILYRTRRHPSTGA